MRLSTSPVGPVTVVALFCAVLATPARAEPNNVVPPAANVAPDEWYEPVAPSAWSFLHDDTAAASESDASQPSSEAQPQPMAGLDGDTPAKPLTEEERQKLNEALVVAPLELGGKSSAPQLLRLRSQARGFDVKRNGANTVVFDQPIAPPTGQWSAKVGADLGVSADQVASANAENPLRVQRNGRAADAAWATFALPSLATVDARVNAGSDQGLLATTFKHSVPIGSVVSLTLQSRTSLTETFGAGTTSFDIPMMTVPVNDAASTGSRIWGQENSARFKIGSTGTSFAAGITSSSADTVTHNTLSAEQQVYGPLQVSTSISDVGQVGENKSVNARFKFNW